MDSKDIKKMFKHYPPTAEQVQKFQPIRLMALTLAMEINSVCPDSPEKTLSIRRLEECLMWAEKSIDVSE